MVTFPTTELIRRLLALCQDVEVDALQRVVLDAHDRGLGDEERRKVVLKELEEMLVSASLAL